MDPETERRTKLLTSAFTSPRGVMPALLDVIDYLAREAKAEAWNEGWKAGFKGEYFNPYQD